MDARKGQNDPQLIQLVARKEERHNQKKNQGIETESRDDRQISMDIKPAIITMPHAY